MAQFDLAAPAAIFIGDVVPQLIVEQDMSDDVRPTDHPVEQGAEITDHAVKLPSAVQFRLGWTNSSEAAAGDKNYITRVYSKLLKLQASRELITISAIRRTYKNMLILNLGVTWDEHTRYSLYVRLRARQIILANTATVIVPPRAVQQFPERTAPTTTTGVKQPRNSILYNSFGSGAGASGAGGG